MRNSVESLLRESYSLNRLWHYKKAARVMHCKVLFIVVVQFRLAYLKKPDKIQG